MQLLFHQKTKSRKISQGIQRKRKKKIHLNQNQIHSLVLSLILLQNLIQIQIKITKVEENVKKNVAEKSLERLKKK